MQNVAISRCCFVSFVNNGKEMNKRNARLRSHCAVAVRLYLIKLLIKYTAK